MYLMLGRRCEPAAIDIEYTEVLDYRVVIDLDADKAHQDGQGMELVRLHDRIDLRPVARVRAWLAWLKTQGITSGPLFRQLSTGDQLTSRARSPPRGHGPALTDRDQ
jgi:hypothetical protein